MRKITVTRLHRLRRLLAMLTIGLAGVGPAAAQPVPCDQGVIRLPDRTGTVQICSALAAQVPALSKQLGEAVKLLGNQQQQIRELTRLVSALNGSSAGLDASRQTQLLRSLSAELARAEQRGPEASRRTIEELSEQFEGLRDQLVQVLSQPASLAATNEALRGRLGDSIAQLETRSATRQLDEIGQRMKQVQADIGTVKAGVAQANSKLDSLAAAVDSAKSAAALKTDLLLESTGRIEANVNRDLTPRERLAKNGVAWTTDSFSAALVDRDVETVRLFIEAGWNVRSAAPRSEGGGNALGYFAGQTRVSNEVATVAIVRLLAGKLDLTAPEATFRGLPPMNLVSVALMRCNANVVRALATAGIDVRLVNRTEMPSHLGGTFTIDPINKLTNWKQPDWEHIPCTAEDRRLMISLVQPTQR